MALRSFFLSKSKSQLPILFSRLSFSPLPSPPSKYSSSSFRQTTPFCTHSETPDPKKQNPKLTNFSPSDSDSDSDAAPPRPDKSKIPPPYNPFSKEPDDPKNLQEVFAKIREDGLMNSAAKMFDGLSQDGLTHEALELFSRIKDRGQMPDVIAHTAVIEAYADAGQAKDAHKVYLRMLASGVAPNAYTYRVLIRGLAKAGAVNEASKYVQEMVRRGMRPSAGACVAVVEGLLRADLEDEATQLLEMLKAKGAAPEEEKIRDAVKSRRGSVPRLVMNVLYGK
ncbi:pentatricopeptide repeat-containing protein At4g38150-like [Salvia hispanica]|uniref:pentatricopeptide repeat-containing protein At4g38150-like n=1 Tax=Salvia hispanica TaxID=49212 RepID=UPI0020092445|nr:pentatricopeptide repeat-containing protein At4g38150-like [Salvia hispanica]